MSLRSLTLAGTTFSRGEKKRTPMSYAMSPSKPLLRTKNSSFKLGLVRGEAGESRHVSGEEEVKGRIAQQLLQDARLDFLDVFQSRRRLSAPGRRCLRWKAPVKLGPSNDAEVKWTMKTAAWMPPPNLLIPHCSYFGSWLVRTDGHNNTFNGARIARDAGSRHCR